MLEIPLCICKIVAISCIHDLKLDPFLCHLPYSEMVHETIFSDDLEFALLACYE